MYKTKLIIGIFFFHGLILAEVTRFSSLTTNIPSDKEALVYIQKFKYHSIKSIINYLYFSRGVFPEKTSVKMDEHLAMAEHYLLMLEKYTDRDMEFKKDFNELSSYWYNLRIKLVHTFNRKFLQKFSDYYERINYISDELSRKIIVAKKISFTEKELNIFKTLIKSNYILFSYILYFINYNNQGYKTLLEKYVHELEQWMAVLKKFKPEGQTKKWNYIVKELRDLIDQVKVVGIPSVTEAENLYLQVDVIENDLIDFL